MQLTSEQQAIINLDFEHCVITAVAGSGKTTTLACRIHKLLEQGHAPERILILMFNRSAKEDFERKMIELCRGSSLKLPEIRTYHAMGYRLYQRFIKDGYLSPINPKVLTEQEVHYQLWQLIRSLAPADLQDEIKRNKKEHVETASHFVDLVKSTLASPEQVFEELEFSDRYRYLLTLFERFEQWRKDHARITFADMLYEPVKLINSTPELQKLVSNKMDMILVDEYQDTNEIQHRLLKYIAGERARVTVVGDPDQTIYEFRGARPEYILNRFTEEFESPKELTLTSTFRYGHKVALLANHLISHNKGRKDVLCHSHETAAQTHIKLHEGSDSRCTLELIQNHLRRGQAAEAIAILCRVWSQTVPIELELLAHDLPYQIDQGKGALSSREIVALVYLLEFSSGRFADLSPESRKLRFSSLLRFPHTGLAEDKVQRLSDVLAYQNSDWSGVLLACIEEGYNPMQKRKLRAFAEALELIGQPKQSAYPALHKYIAHTGLYEGIRNIALTNESAEEKIGIVKGFLNYVKALGRSNQDTLNHIDQLKDKARRMKGAHGVLLTTIHRAKGLEWPVVIIPGLVEKYLPYTQRENKITPALIESERRLLYVAMTRARDQLHLITSGSQSATQESESVSRFLAELRFKLSDHLGEHIHRLDASKQEIFNSPVALSLVSRRYCQMEGIRFIAPEETVKPDEELIVWSLPRVRHAIFGDGNVLSETESSFQVKFDDGQTMDFSKKSAHLYFSAI